jgi:hypothetical protein
MPSGHRPPIPPGFARVALLGTYQTHHWTQIFYLQLTGTGITAADLTTLAGDIATDYTSNVKPMVPASVVLTGIDITFVPSVGNEVVANTSQSITGTLAGTDVSNAATCFVVNWTISAYYRGGHPRTYMPGVITADLTNGSVVSSARQSSVANNWNNFRIALNAYTTTNISGVVMGTLSFASGNAWRATPLFRTFTGASTRSTVGIQKRRLKS